MIIDERKCVACGYSLHGLWSDGVCPECGRPILTRRKEIPRYSDNLIHAPMGWLQGFSFGSTMLALSGIGLIATLVALALTMLETVAFAALLCAAGWSLATFITTRPRPVTKATTMPPQREWATLRWASRVTQIFWVVLCVAVLARIEMQKGGASTGGTDQALTIAAFIAFVVAGLGTIPFCVILSNLAFWAEDSGLAQHLRGCAWTVALSAGATLLSYLQVRSGIGAGIGAITVLVTAMMAACMYFPLFYMTYCLWSLQNMARWAVKNHVTAEARDIRLREKAARAALNPAAPTSKPIEPGPIPLAEDSMMP